MMHILAYIDPGSGSLFVQVAIAAVLAVPFFLRSQIRRALGLMRGAIQEPPSPDAANKSVSRDRSVED